MKKEYTKPTMQVVEITKNSGILCSSVVGVYGTSYRNGRADNESLDEGDYWEDL